MSCNNIICSIDAIITRIIHRTKSNFGEEPYDIAAESEVSEPNLEDTHMERFDVLFTYILLIIFS